jgi:hypothetical protein
VGILGTVGAGVVRGPITVTLPGSQTVWIQGSFGREVTVRVDGKEIGRVGDELAQPANWIALGDVDLRAGRHQLEISRGGRTPAPQSGDSGRTLGSVALTPAAERARLQRVPPARYRELCDRPADWIEVVSP